MNLIDKQDRLLAIHAQLVLSFFYGFFHILFSGGGGIQLGKVGTGGISDNFSQSSFSCSGRTVKDQRTEFVRFDGTVKHFSFSDDVLLPYDFFQCFRTHPGRQWRFLFECCLFHI